MKQAFGVGASKAWRRTSFIVSHKGGKSLLRFLVEVFEYPTNKSRSIRVPELISMMPDPFVAKFLRGFFDAEGFVQEGRNIGVGCEGVALMKQLPMLLARFGCLAYFGKKSHGREIFISGKDNVKAFVDQIGFGEKEKMLGSKNQERDLRDYPHLRHHSHTWGVPKEDPEGHKVIWDERFQITTFEARSKISRDVISHLPAALPTLRQQGASETVNNYASVQVLGPAGHRGSLRRLRFHRGRIPQLPR